MKADRTRRIFLVLALAVALAGAVLEVHDTPLLALSVAALGLVWVERNWRAWMVAAGMLAVGLVWSSLDFTRSSTWWKGHVAFAKVRGELPYVPWKHAGVLPLSRGSDFALLSDTELLDEKTVAGRACEKYRTALGDFWITSPGQHTVGWMVWEMLVQRVYESEGAKVEPGDTVIDCGAHVGIFSRHALRQGAGLVVAVEPDPVNRTLLEENLRDEIAAGKVIVIAKGVWDTNTVLPMWVDPDNSGASSFVIPWDGAEETAGIPLTRLDDIVEELKLERVDFIKMDIEGAEPRALKGALGTMRRFEPHLAICAYHQADDPDMVAEIVLSSGLHYVPYAKDVDVKPNHEVTPKVLFFD